MASNQHLRIDEIQILAAFKTNNPNISAQEAVQELNKVAPNASYGFDAQSVNGWGVQTGYKWAGNIPTQISTSKEPDKIAAKLFNLSEKYYGAVNEKDFQAELNRLNQTNAIAVWKQYNKISPDESLIEMICDEKANSANDRQKAVQKVFNALVAEAKSKGVDTSHFEAEFRADLNYQFRKIGTTDAEKLDKIANSLIFAADNKASLTPTEKAEIKNTPATTQHANTNTMIANRLDNSKTEFTKQLKQDGWAADVADFVSKAWGSDNTADKIRGDLAKADGQLKNLQKAQTNNAYSTEFYKTFGLEYDAENIKAYENKEATYKNAALNKGFEDAYNNTVKVLLSRPQLQEEVTYVSQGQFAGARTVVTADKWDVYNREVNNLKKFLGDKASDVLMIELRKAHLENASLDAKYAFLHEKALAISKKLHANTVEAGGNKEFAEVEKDYQYSYNAAFGVKNDIMKRVNDYNISQQVGGGVVKMATVGAVAISASFFTGGSSLALLTVAGVTAGTSFTVEVSDRFSSGQVVDAFKDGGFTAGMKKGAEVTDWNGALKNAVISGGTVLIGGGIAKGVQFVSSGLTPVKQAALMFGTDVAFGAGVEKVMTGEITVQGMVFTVALSAAGNIIAIKQANKANNVNQNPPITNKPSEIGGLSNTGKPQLKPNLHEIPDTKPPEIIKPTANEPVVAIPKVQTKPTVEATQIKPFFEGDNTVHPVIDKIAEINKQYPDPGTLKWINDWKLDAVDYDNMAKLMNMHDGKHIGIWKATTPDNIPNMQKFAVLEKVLRRTGAIDDITKLGANEWDVIVNSVCSNKSQEVRNAILKYRVSSKDINTALSGKNPVTPDIEVHIKALTEFLDNSILPHDIKVYRGEGYNGVLNTRKTSDGNPIGDAMKELVARGATDTEIQTFINRELKNNLFKQERFLSTALTEDFAKDWAHKGAAKMVREESPHGGICWEIDAPKGSKGAYIEDFNLMRTDIQNEVLFQKDSKLIVRNVEYDKTTKTWIIKARLAQN